MAVGLQIFRNCWKFRSNTSRHYFILMGFILSGFLFLCYTNLNSSSYLSTQFSILRQVSGSYKFPELFKALYSRIGYNQNDPIFVNSNLSSNLNSTTENIVDLSTTSMKIKQNFQVTEDTTLTSEKSISVSSSTEAILTKESTFSKPKFKETTEKVSDIQSKITFSRHMGEFNWTFCTTAVMKNDETLMKICWEKLIVHLSYFLALPPIVPINSNCTALRLLPPEEIICSKYPTGFTGVRNNESVKIGILIQFGFDVDVLEIYLNEVYDVVDKFFIIESTKAHHETLPKPLLWEAVQHQERFLKFAPKLTHFIIDDAQNADVWVKMNTTIWLMEGLQETLRWKKFLKWNEARRFFTDRDVIGFGDADEVPCRKMVNMLKYCQLKGGFLDFGIWFPFGNISQAFKTDHPVSGHPYTLGDPTFWTLQSALALHKSTGRIPSRGRGSSPSYLLGGMHMTHYGYLPFQFVKRITQTESTGIKNGVIEMISRNLTHRQIRTMELKMGAVPSHFQHRIVKLVDIAEEMKDIAVLPWFYNCNRDRYSVWEGRSDSRLYSQIPEV